MRFFRRDWFASDNEAVDDDTAANRVLLAYELFLDSFQGPVGKKIQNFCRAHNLHDALIDRLAVGPSSTELELVIGDMQVGYTHLNLKYSEARLSAASTSEIRAALAAENTEILHDEFDILEHGDAGLYVHRFLLWPEERKEFAIAFRDIEAKSATIETRERLNRGERFTQR